jgi:hypothetical protein
MRSPAGQSVLPAGAKLETSLNLIKERMDTLGMPKPDRDQLLERLRDRQIPADSLFLYPYFCDEQSSLFEYFPKDTVYWWDGPTALMELLKDAELPRLRSQVALLKSSHSRLPPSISWSCPNPNSKNAWSGIFSLKHLILGNRAFSKSLLLS